MERRIIGIVFGIMVAVSTIWAEEQKGTLTLEPIWEKEFEDGLREVCELEPTSVGTKTRGLAEPSFSLKAVETGNGVIKFFNEEGKVSLKVKKERENEWVGISKNGKYVKIQAINDPKAYYKTGETTLELKDHKGNTLYKIDGVPDCAEISPNGAIVATCPSFPGHISDYYIGLSFYSPSGSLTKRIDNIKLSGASAFSKDGSLYVTASILEKRDESFKGRKNSLVVFNTKGEELWRYNIDNMVKFYNIKISDDKRFIAVCSRGPQEDNPEGHHGPSYLHIFNKEGNLLGTYSVEFRYETTGILGRRKGYLSFSPEGDYLATTDYRNLYFFDTNRGELLWSHSFGFPFCIYSVSLSSDAKLIAVGGIYEVPNARSDRYIWLFDKSGNKIMEKNIGKSYTGDVILNLSPDGKQLFMTTYEKTVFFNLK
ncbi:MAG: WD40 repeat domain-containing protein [bacterium]